MWVMPEPFLADIRRRIVTEPALGRTYSRMRRSSDPLAHGLVNQIGEPRDMAEAIERGAGSIRAKLAKHPAARKLITADPEIVESEIVVRSEAYFTELGLDELTAFAQAAAGLHRALLVHITHRLLDAIRHEAALPAILEKKGYRALREPAGRDALERVTAYLSQLTPRERAAFRELVDSRAELTEQNYARVLGVSPRTLRWRRQVQVRKSS
jgi:DNA-binding CsgD family transcriptional regulator